MTRPSKLLFAIAFLASLGLTQKAMAQSKYTGDVLALNPLGYWRLDGDANDATVHADNGTLNGVTFTLPGGGAPIGDPNSEAGVFHLAQNQFISIPAGEPAAHTLFDIDWNQPITMMAWVKTSGVASTMLVLAKEDNTSSFSGQYIAIDNGTDGVEPVGSGRLVMVIQGSPSTFLRVSTIAGVNDGNWHFLVGTYDGSGQAAGIQLYIDGGVAATMIRKNTLSSTSTVNAAPVTIGGGVQGALAYDGLIGEAAIFGTALAANQIRQLDNDGFSTSSILPQFVFGGGWYSALYFTNTSGNAVQFPVDFIADNGSPLNLPAPSGPAPPTVTLNIAPHGSAVIEAPNSGPLSQGFVVVPVPPGVVGYGVFRQSVPGQPDQEAVVPLSFAFAITNTFVWDDTNSITAVAIVNPSSTSTNVRIVIRDLSGATI